MLKALSVSLKLSLFTFACLFTSPTLAQVTTDGTVNTQVNQDGNVAEITGGENRGGNLFHSFQDFSVQTGNEAFFNNANDISNIFSRVTGDNISNIDGALRANGSANLFLINPAGIIFGENARLDIGGSFYGSTASSILFENGEFSAVDNLSQPTLTVNAPIGLGFRDNPGDIVNRSITQNSDEEVIGLEVSPGNNLTFIGGDLNFEGGNLTAKGGNIEIASLSETGVINLNQNGVVNFTENFDRGNITLSNASELDVRSSSGGNINIYANNLNLEVGERGVSRIRAGISPDSTSTDAQAGDININATGNISLNESRITNNQEATSNGGNIFIVTDSLVLQNGSDIVSNTLGQGNAGAIDIVATGDITIDGEDSSGFASGIFSQINPGAEGNSGGITISTTNLNLTNGGVVDGTVLGQGNSGAIDVIATGDITADGENSQGFPSGIINLVNPSAVGNSGEITISTTNLNLTSGGNVAASTLGQGNAGAIDVTATGDITADGENSQGFPSGITNLVNRGAVGETGGITISTTNLNLTNGGRIDASTLGQGNSGAIDVIATGNLTADGENSQGVVSSITSQINPDAVGDSGGVTISTTNLNLTNGGRVAVSILGQGNAGAVDITVTGDITADGENLQGFPSGITSQIDSGAEGDSGGITISTTNLNLTNGGVVDSSTLSKGNSGVINVIATDNLTADGENSQGFPSGITSGVNPSAEGDSGGVTISTANLNLTNGGRIDASTSGQGNAGAVDITATGNLIADGGNSEGFSSGITSGVNSSAEGDSGEITISTTNLNLTNGGRINASTSGRGNAGAVDVTASESIFIDGSIARSRSGVSANAINQDGNGGDVFISTGNLSIANGGTVEATNFDTTELVTSSGTGRPGSITIAANSIDLTDDARIETATRFAGEESGIINLQVAKNITLQGNSFISAEAFGEANGGNLNIDTDFIIAFPGNNDIIANAEQGQGGNININAESLFGIAERPLNDSTNDINASSEFSLDGTVNVSTPDVNPAQGVTELPNNIVVPEETTQQACEANRESAAKNGLNITGKGGIVPEPGLPLDSLNVTVNGESTSAEAIPQPIETSKGKIQLARGIKVAESGEIILTPHRSHNEQQKILEASRNCG